MLRALIFFLGIAVAVMWGGLVLRSTPNMADMQCPPKEVRVRYPKSMSDGKGYRIAYCKPTGIDWRR